MKNCETCKEIEYWLERHKVRHNIKTYAKISQYTYNERKKEIGWLNSDPLPLKFCPTCGEKINFKK